MNSAISLETVAKHFAAWRMNRQTLGRSVTPIHLQQEAVTLKSNHSKKEITEALGINHSTLKRWAAAQDTTTLGFVELTTEPIDIALEVSSNNASCEFPNGMRLTLPVNEISSNLLQQISQISQTLKP